MKKNNLVWIIVLLMLLVGCKSKADSSVPTSESLIEQARQAAQAAIDNATIPESEQQIVIPPQSVQQQIPQAGLWGSNAVITKDYIAPCKLQKYKILNAYCKGKTFWIKQSTLTSWYVSYSIVLFLLLLFVIWFIIKLWNQR